MMELFKYPKKFPKDSSAPFVWDIFWLRSIGGILGGLSVIALAYVLFIAHVPQNEVPWILMLAFGGLLITSLIFWVKDAPRQAKAILIGISLVMITGILGFIWYSLK